MQRLRQKEMTIYGVELGDIDDVVKVFREDGYELVSEHISCKPEFKSGRATRWDAGYYDLHFASGG